MKSTKNRKWIWEAISRGRTALVVTVIIASAACARGTTGPSDIGEATPPLGVLRATIDGATKEFVAEAATDSTTNLITIGGEDSPLTSFIALQTRAVVGTRSTPDEDVIGAYAKSATYEEAGWAAYLQNGSGTVTIKSITSTSVTGTFSFTLVPYGTATGTKLIANGTFNAPLYSN